MSLNFELGAIANYEAVCYRGPTASELAEGAKDSDRFMTGLTEALIYATMGIGMNTITEKNAADFYKRIAFYEAVHGTWLRKASEPDAEGKWHLEPRPITFEDVQAHIGLRTNASKFTDAQFASLMFRNFRRGR